MSEPRKILFCNCTYAKVVPEDTKAEVLRRLAESDVAFDAVPDLCDMAARRDPGLSRIASCGGARIAACFPRSVRWLFHQAGSPLPDEGFDILNMREEAADEIAAALLGPDDPTRASDESASAQPSNETPATGASES